MQLPGGIFINDVRITRCDFKPMCGDFELVCCEFANRFDLLPPREVTDLLTMSLAHVGQQPIVWRDVHNMAVGDRQFLLRSLMIALGHDDCWMTSVCHECQNRFDFNITLSDLPVNQCSESFPFVDIVINAYSYRFRAPSGADQEELAQEQNENEHDILSLLLMPLGGRDKRSSSFPRYSAEQQNMIETEIENMAPKITSKIQAACPECDNLMIIDISPERAILQLGKNIYTEVHQIASTYHWSEGEILKMPTQRRKNYLSLIERAKGRGQRHHYVA